MKAVSVAFFRFFIKSMSSLLNAAVCACSCSSATDTCQSPPAAKRPIAAIDLNGRLGLESRQCDFM